MDLEPFGTDLSRDEEGSFITALRCLLHPLQGVVGQNSTSSNTYTPLVPKIDENSTITYERNALNTKLWSLYSGLDNFGSFVDRKKKEDPRDIKRKRSKYALNGMNNNDDEELSHVHIRFEGTGQNKAAFLEKVIHKLENLTDSTKSSNSNNSNTTNQNDSGGIDNSNNDDSNNNNNNNIIINNNPSTTSVGLSFKSSIEEFLECVLTMKAKFVLTFCETEFEICGGLLSLYRDFLYVKEDYEHNNNNNENNKFNVNNETYFNTNDTLKEKWLAQMRFVLNENLFEIDFGTVESNNSNSNDGNSSNSSSSNSSSSSSSSSVDNGFDFALVDTKLLREHKTTNGVGSLVDIYEASKKTEEPLSVTMAMKDLLEFLQKCFNLDNHQFQTIMKNEACLQLNNTVLIAELKHRQAGLDHHFHYKPSKFYEEEHHHKWVESSQKEIESILSELDENQTQTGNATDNFNGLIYVKILNISSDIAEEDQNPETVLSNCQELPVAEMKEMDVSSIASIEEPESNYSFHNDDSDDDDFYHSLDMTKNNIVFPYLEDSEDMDGIRLDVKYPSQSVCLELWGDHDQNNNVYCSNHFSNSQVYGSDHYVGEIHIPTHYFNKDVDKGIANIWLPLIRPTNPNCLIKDNQEHEREIEEEEEQQQQQPEENQKNKVDYVNINLQFLRESFVNRPSLNHYKLFEILVENLIKTETKNNLIKKGNEDLSINLSNQINKYSSNSVRLSDNNNNNNGNSNNDNSDSDNDNDNNEHNNKIKVYHSGAIDFFALSHYIKSNKYAKPGISGNNNAKLKPPNYSAFPKMLLTPPSKRKLTSSSISHQIDYMVVEDKEKSKLRTSSSLQNISSQDDVFEDEILDHNNQNNNSVLDVHKNDYPYPSEFSVLTFGIVEEYRKRYGIRIESAKLAILHCLSSQEISGDIDVKVMHSLVKDFLAYSFDFETEKHTLTIAEEKKFVTILERTIERRINQFTKYKDCFPYGKPLGSLESSIAFLDYLLQLPYFSKLYSKNYPDLNSILQACVQDGTIMMYDRMSAMALPDYNNADDSLIETLKMIEIVKLFREQILDDDMYFSKLWPFDLLKTVVPTYLNAYSADIDSYFKSSDARLSDQIFDLYYILKRLRDDYLEAWNSINGDTLLPIVDWYGPLVYKWLDETHETLLKLISDIGPRCTKTMSVVEDVVGMIFEGIDFLNALGFPDSRMGMFKAAFVQIIPETLEVFSNNIKNRCHNTVTNIQTPDWTLDLRREMCIGLSNIFSVRKRINRVFMSLGIAEEVASGHATFAKEGRDDPMIYELVKETYRNLDQTYDLVLQDTVQMFSTLAYVAVKSATFDKTKNYSPNTRRASYNIAAGKPLPLPQDDDKGLLRRTSFGVNMLSRFTSNSPSPSENLQQLASRKLSQTEIQAGIAPVKDFLTTNLTILKSILKDNVTVYHQSLKLIWKQSLCDMCEIIFSSTHSRKATDKILNGDQLARLVTSLKTLKGTFQANSKVDAMDLEGEDYAYLLKCAKEYYTPTEDLIHRYEKVWETPLNPSDPHYQEHLGKRKNIRYYLDILACRRRDAQAENFVVLHRNDESTLS